MSGLLRLGWCAFFRDQIVSESDPSTVPARVVEDGGGLWRVHDGTDERLATLSGRLRHGVVSPDALPVAGDWVLIRRSAGDRRCVVARVLERRRRLVRKAAGAATLPQTLAANVDTVLVVQGLDGGFNPSRLERQIAAVRGGGAAPVVVLNKADRCADVDARRAIAETLAGGAPVHVVSAASGDGVAALASYLRQGDTVALIGSSGVGKSTLLNRLAGRDLQRVRDVRSRDGRGRHTTARRRLVLLDEGGMILDTPGMRELALWETGEGLDLSFADIADLAQECRFRDCSHLHEPGCAVRAAAERGTLDPRRLASHRKLESEARNLEVRRDAALRREQNRRWRAIHRALRRAPKRG